MNPIAIGVPIRKTYNLRPRSRAPRNAAPTSDPIPIAAHVAKTPSRTHVGYFMVAIVLLLFVSHWVTQAPCSEEIRIVSGVSWTFTSHVLKKITKRSHGTFVPLGATLVSYGTKEHIPDWFTTTTYDEAVETYKTHPDSTVIYVYDVEDWVHKGTIFLSSERGHTYEEALNVDWSDDEELTRQKWTFRINFTDGSSSYLDANDHRSFNLAKSRIGAPVTIQRCLFGLWKTVKLYNDPK